jgi:hypothetical protein
LSSTNHRSPVGLYFRRPPPIHHTFAINLPHNLAIKPNLPAFVKLFLFPNPKLMGSNLKKILIIITELEGLAASCYAASFAE